MSGSRVWFGALSALALAVGAVATGVAAAATSATVFGSPFGDELPAGIATAAVSPLTRARDLTRADGPGTTRRPAAEFVYTGGDGLWSTWYGLGPWTEARCPVGGISGTTITMAQPCWDNSTKRPPDPNHPTRSIGEVGPGDLHAGRQPAYVENA